ncbi:serine/threonine-protein phosphatase 7 long form homolog [Arachis ipaensis]|uniref:serine/threonine-protein phosphatase 7 long form homolog n=1 Tax=Arachis ipaensis TaxID=130454 RepID=UPI000A2B12A7|nr:serine/threonine-protein phosphatase 7 long form homolog [Arachis ipaensis]
MFRGRFEVLNQLDGGSMEDEGRMYRLNGVAHVAGYIEQEPSRVISGVRRQQNMPLHDQIIPYLETAGLYHLARLNSQWFWVDEPLLSAFIERWRPETHTFHMPFGECTITLQDVAYQLGLPIDGEPVSGCLTEFENLMENGRPAWVWFRQLFGELPPQNKIKQMTVCYTWFHERFRVLPVDASEETVRIYARAYILMLLSSQLFADKNANRVHLRWLPYLASMDDLGRYSWGSAALAWLYRCLCRGTNRNVVNLASPLQLLQSWIFWRFPSLRPSGFDVFGFPLASRWATYLPRNDAVDQRVVAARLSLDRLRFHDFVWEPYSSPEVAAVVHPEILVDEHRRLWTAVTSLIYFAAIEWHQVDRVVPQFGGVQHLPQFALNIDWLHAKDGRGGDRWFPRYYQEWHLHWENRVDSVIPVEQVADPGPSAEYLDWWCRVGHRFLSPDVAFHDLRPIVLTEEARHRGSSQAPPRVQVPDRPDNRQVDRRRRIGTRTTDREWRWLDDRLDEDLVGADDRGVVDHRVPRRRARRQGGRDGRGRARATGIR